MEAELAALAASGATTLVGLMVSDAWSRARDRVARFFAGGGDENAARDALGVSQRELMAARASEDELAVADIEAEWRLRLRRALRADPEAAEELRKLLAELAPQAGNEPPGVFVQNNISGGVQHGPVFQGQNFSGLTFNSSGTATPEQGPEGVG